MRYQVDDDAGLIAYLDRVTPDLYRRVSRLTSGNRQLTEQIVQDAVSALVRQARSRALSEVEFGWLTTTTRDEFIDCIRFRSGHDRSTERQRKPKEPVGGIGDVAALSSEQARRLLGRLPDRERWALGLQVVDGLSLAEVATALSWTLGATKAVLGGASRRLRELVDHDQAVDEPALFDRAAADISPDFLGRLRSMVTAGHRPEEAATAVAPPTATASSAARDTAAGRKRRVRIVTLTAWAIVTVAVVAVILANRGDPFVAPPAQSPNEAGFPVSGPTLRPPASDAPSGTTDVPSTTEATSTTGATSTTQPTSTTPAATANPGTGATPGTGLTAGTSTAAGEPPVANVTDVSGPWPDSADQDALPLPYLVPAIGLEGLNLKRNWDASSLEPPADPRAVPYDQVLLSPDAAVQLRITTQAEPTLVRPATDIAFSIGPWLATPVDMAEGFSALDLQADAGVVRLWSRGLTGTDLNGIAQGLIRRAPGEPGWDLSIRPRDVAPFVEDWQTSGAVRTMGWYTAGGELEGEFDYGRIGFDGLTPSAGIGSGRISTMSIRGRRVHVTIGEGRIRMWWREADGSYARFGVNDRGIDDAIAVVESLVEADHHAWLALPLHPRATLGVDDVCGSLFC